VDTCLNANDADKILKELKYDLLVTDIIMPGRSGVELIRWVRESGNDIQICVYSSIRDKETIDEFELLNVSLLVMKPGIVPEVAKELLTLV